MSTGIFTILNAVGPLVGAMVGPLVFEGVEGHAAILRRLKWYNHTLAALSFALLALLVVYFPEHPPTPVSPTAEQERLSYKDSFLKLFSHVNFLIIMSVTCLVIGSNQPLSCLLTTILTKHGLTQVESG